MTQNRSCTQALDHKRVQAKRFVKTACDYQISLPNWLFLNWFWEIAETYGVDLALGTRLMRLANYAAKAPGDIG